jgi:hypothetical protein
MTLVREPDAGNPRVRFDEREVETEHGMRLLRHKRGNPETEYVEAYPTAPPLDSTLLWDGHAARIRTTSILVASPVVG